ncbi:MAG: hypothetical protein WKF58_10290 [Ilumatobacteraceae bacterium]
MPHRSTSASPGSARRRRRRRRSTTTPLARRHALARLRAQRVPASPASRRARHHPRLPHATAHWESIRRDDIELTGVDAVLPILGL